MIDENTIRTLLQSQIMQALKSAPEAIDELLAAAINKPVDEHTGSPDRGYGKKVPYLEWACGNAIRHALDAAIREEIAAMQDNIRALVKNRLSADDVVESFTKTFLQAAGEDWRIKVMIGKGDQ